MKAARLDAYIGIRVTEETKQELEEHAKQEGRSVSNWILHKLLTEVLPSYDNPRRMKRT